MDKVGLRGIKIDRNGRFEEFLKLGAGQKILRGGGGGGGCLIMGGSEKIHFQGRELALSGDGRNFIGGDS